LLLTIAFQLVCDLCENDYWDCKQQQHQPPFYKASNKYPFIADKNNKHTESGGKRRYTKMQ
jgi:hypothetical protein